MWKILALAILVIVLAGCGSPPPAPEAAPTFIPPTAPPIQPILIPTDSPGDAAAGGNLGVIPATVPAEIAVRFSTRTQVFNDTVLIDIAIDVPDGAVVHYVVREGEDGQGPREAEGTMNITGKHGSADVDVSDWEGPLVQVEVAFRPWDEIQPVFINQNFGEDGAKLVGDNVSTLGTKKLIEAASVLRFPTVREYRGLGPDIVGPFPLAPGVVTLFAKHEGQGDFRVHFLRSGHRTGVSLDGSGEYLGERAFAIASGDGPELEPGEYQLEVTGDGPWLLELDQEFPTGGFIFPLGAEDVGDEVIRWLKLKEGRYQLRADHAGESSFVVELLSATGGSGTRLIDESGDFDGGAEINITTEPDQGIPPGFYALAVRADGHWNLSVAE